MDGWEPEEVGRRVRAAPGPQEASNRLGVAEERRRIEKSRLDSMALPEGTQVGLLNAC
jgi:hypothetical protein